MRCVACFGFVVASLLAANSGADEPGEAESSSGDSVLVVDADADGLKVSGGMVSVSASRAKVQRAKIGLPVSCVFVALGAGAIAGGVIAGRNQDDLSRSIGVTAGLTSVGVIALIGGLVGIGLSSNRLSQGKRELRDWEEGQRKRSHRLRWEPGTSRFVF